MLYLFAGEETYLLDKKVEKLIADVPTPELNVSTFGEDYSVSEMRNAVETVPFFSDKRAVVLRVKELKGDEELKAILSKIPSCVDFILATEKIDKRGSIWKMCKDNVTDCSKPDLDKVVEFIARAVKREGRNVQRVAAEEIVKRLNYYEEPGVNLYAVLGVVKQIAVNSDITLSAVQATLPESSAGKAYSLAQLICEKRENELFSLSQYLLDSGDNEIGLLSLISRVFRLAWCEKIGEHPSVPKYQYQVALGFSTEKLSTVQDVIASAISYIKDGTAGNIVFPVTLVKVLQALHG